MHGHQSCGTRCINVDLNLYLHLSLCVRAVKAPSMLCTSAGTPLTKHAWPATKWSLLPEFWPELFFVLFLEFVRSEGSGNAAYKANLRPSIRYSNNV